jgi:hypothetical protein
MPFYLRQTPRLKNDPAEWLPGFESERQVAQRYEARGRLIFTGNSICEPNFYWCEHGYPCDSAACPRCMREFRRWLVDAGITLFEQSHGQLSAVSLVHYSWSRSPDNLNSFGLPKAKRQTGRHFDRAGVGNLVAIGGFDFSYNQPADGSAPYWQPHAYVILQGIEPEALKQAISPFYPSTAAIPRPIRTRRVTDLMEALSYTTKAIFFRRASYKDANGRLNSRTLPLLASAERELLTYLDQLYPVDRLFLKNVRRQGATLIPKLSRASAPSSVLTIRLPTAKRSSRSLSPKNSG